MVCRKYSEKESEQGQYEIVELGDVGFENCANDKQEAKRVFNRGRRSDVRVS